MSASARLAAGSWLVAALLCACGEPTHTIRRTLAAGDQWRYTLELTGDLRGNTETLKLEYTDTVQRVAPDGSAIAERVLQASPEQIQALQARVGPFGVVKPKSRWKLLPDGRETPLEPEGFFIGAFTYAYPDRPVRTGAQWGRTDGFGSLQVKYLCRFEGLETLNGIRCYKIHTDIEPMPDSLPRMQGEMTVYVDAERGWVRQIRGTLKMQAGALEGSFQLHLRGAPAGEQP
ncbi:MAG: hypothetical protein NZ556_01810 [Fimbriimonadales bacterium]|nr:hypothetical protein [Fimbriimonadales bacterium]